MSNKLSLKGARAAAKLSQSNVAKHMEVSVQTVFKWERGISPVARERWERLAALLHLSLTELESALIQTLLDACTADGSTRALDNAKDSRLYDSNLIADAYARFERRDKKVFPQINEEVQPRANEQMELICSLRNEIGDLKNKLGDIKIAYAELKEENAALKAKIEQLLNHDRQPMQEGVDFFRDEEEEDTKTPAASISSVLNINPIKLEVNHE